MGEEIRKYKLGFRSYLEYANVLEKWKVTGGGKFAGETREHKVWVACGEWKVRKVLSMENSKTQRREA